MTIYYKDGFYFKDQKVPVGAVEISEERYIELLNGQSNGKIIISDKSGNPILINPAPSAFHELKNGEWKITKAKQKEQLNAEKTRLVLFTANKVDEMKSALLSGYPQAEIDSFYKQEKEALAYKADNSADTPMLKIIAQTRGVPFDLLVEKVLEKSSQFSHAMGSIIGQRQKFEDRILATESIEDLTVIENEVKEWQFNLAS
ncbi:hypothetical protein [Pasteurella multocida]|uniref:hypothetical protein n=1 Tax=Pasteurella multocida TaxID=747 RepID=UPI0028DEC5C0|nr:hypothetical protein [Pasteurella multocida]HDR1154416.1 hypothetical protein [Pasteurella multocida]HDR1165440.1 hypothetical protein [Pasteurella multocida]HDR1345971.1 hypothetical protein [Pasteurella multocida]HDR1500030.1 hypothetical protein [Pasteurella multocida]